MSVKEIDLTMNSNDKIVRQMEAQREALGLFYDIIELYEEADLPELALTLMPTIRARIASLKKEQDYFLPIHEVTHG